MNLWERKKLILISLIVLLGLGFSTIWSNWREAGDGEKETKFLPVSPSRKQSVKVNICISGAVFHPGVYQVTPGIRVQQALLLAGGFTEEAAVHRVNLAKKCKDGMHINVPFLPRGKNSSSPAPLLKRDKQQRKHSVQERAGWPQLVDKHKQWRGKKKKLRQKVNINTANAEELKELPGVGHATAEAILKYRQWHRFYFKWEIKNVPGISKAKYRAMEHLLEV